MIAARILAYGPEYKCEVTLPESGEKITHTFNLADCPFKELPKDVDYSKNEFSATLPISKTKVNYRLLTGKEEKLIDAEIKSRNKLGVAGSAEITTRLKHVITSVNGEDSAGVINEFSQNILAKESLFLREQLRKIQPDIELTQEVEWEGETVTVNIPMTVEFFWPGSEA